MIDVTFEHITWRVLGFRFEGATAEEDSGREYERLVRQYVTEGPGDISIWRSTVPDRTVWAIIVCGEAEKLPTDVAGIPDPLDERQARMFALRRARQAYEAVEANPLADASTSVRHWAQGARIHDDGTLGPPA